MYDVAWLEQLGLSENRQPQDTVYDNVTNEHTFKSFDGYTHF